jgi:hypothetical protein
MLNALIIIGVGQINTFRLKYSKTHAFEGAINTILFILPTLLLIMAYRFSVWKIDIFDAVWTIITVTILKESVVLLTENRYFVNIVVWISFTAINFILFYFRIEIFITFCINSILIYLLRRITPVQNKFPTPLTLQRLAK